MKFHYIPTRIAKIEKLTTPNVGKEVEQLELSHTAARYVKWCSHFGKREMLCKIKKHFLYTSENLLLDIYPNGMRMYVHTTTSLLMFTAALFITTQKPETQMTISW